MCTLLLRIARAVWHYLCTGLLRGQTGRIFSWLHLWLYQQGYWFSFVSTSFLRYRGNREAVDSAVLPSTMRDVHALCPLASPRMPRSNFVVTESHPLATVAESSEIFQSSESVAVPSEAPSDPYEADRPLPDQPERIDEGNELGDNLPETSLTASPPTELSAMQLAAYYEGFQPILPETVARYDGPYTIENVCRKFPIEPFRTEFFDVHHIDGWELHTHPEGARFLYHEEKRMFTEANLFIGEIKREFEIYADAFHKRLERMEKTLDDDVDIVFELIPRGNNKSRNSLSKYTCNYYLVKHSTRTVFWLDRFDASKFAIWHEVPDVTSPSHVRHMIEASYWYHCFLYPNLRPWNTEAINKIRVILNLEIGGSITLLTCTTTPYSVSELQQLLSVVDSMQGSVAPDMPEAVAILARVMNSFAQEKFRHFHGQTSASPNHNKPAYAYRFIILSALLFTGPTARLNSLRTICSDKIMNHTVYGNLVRELRSEWNLYMTFAMVLLPTNVGLLAIQSVGTELSLVQIYSHLSILLSLGSTIVGLILTLRHSQLTRKSATRAANQLLRNYGDQSFALKAKAVIWSIPYGLFLWAMYCFSLSIGTLIFRIAHAPLRALFGGTMAIMGILILWTMLYPFESTHECSVERTPRRERRW